MKALYKLHYDCGKQGTLDGTFVSEKENVADLINSEQRLNFGCVFGGAEITGELTDDDVTLVTTDEKFIHQYEEFDLVSGYNPFDYIEEEEDELEEEDIENSEDYDY